MSRVDTDPLRQLFDHLGIKPQYVTPSLVDWQIQEHHPQEKLPQILTDSVDGVRDLAVMSRDYLQIGVFEFSVGLDFLQGGRMPEAVQYFDSARRQWLFIDHLPLISLAHLGTGMAHHAEGHYRRAAAAYFKVRQCLDQADTEPHRLRKIEAERSLQPFWEDLERSLSLATSSLGQEFTAAQENRIRSELGTVARADADADQDDRDLGKYATTMKLRLQPDRAAPAVDVNSLLYRIVNDILALDLAMVPVEKVDVRPPPKITRIDFEDQSHITIELSDLVSHTVVFFRWLMTTIPTDDRSNLEGIGPSRARFSFQGQSDHVAVVIKSYTKSVAGRELGEKELEQLMQAIGHLAEVRANRQLTVV